MILFSHNPVKLRNKVKEDMRKIQVVDYNPAWPDLFRAESALLSQTLGSIAIGIHHIGSTAVPGLPAKPIIDILIEVTDLALLDALNDHMMAIGYRPNGEFGIPERRYFHKGGYKRTHHIHAFAYGDFNVKRHIAFRDYLRLHATAAKAYGELKKHIAMTCHTNISKYCDGKNNFVKHHTAIALEQNAPDQPPV
jgi:GrpB-like predicted nucleotidyltransferase (UPF0157 family)